MKVPRRFVVLTAVILSGLCAGPASGAELTGKHVLVIANSKSRQSLPLAQRYAERRKIPPTNILTLPCPLRDTISHSQYEHLIARPVRTFIEQRDLAEQIKVIVTIYGMPLRVAAAKPDPQYRQLVKALTGRYHREFATLEVIYNQMVALAGQATSQPATLPARDRTDRFARVRHRMLRRINKLLPSIRKKIGNQATTQGRREILTRAIGLKTKLFGLGQFSHTKQTPEKVATKIDRARQKFSSMVVESPGRRDLQLCYALAQQIGGQALLLNTIYEDISRLKQRHSLAAVDDELTMVMHRDYMLAGRIPNVLNERLADHPFAARWTPVFMTARLDGPTPAVVKRMIDDAGQVESRGLTGTAYIDAEGDRPRSAKFRYDDSLRQLAKLLKTRSQLKVVLDNQRAVFAPGTCPQAAIYCGHYSLRKYVPAFQFVPGAVAFHIASFEAQNLHSPTTNLWCPKLLEAGAAATLGPVAEPFLDAFPLPAEFFSMLLSGKYTLVEAFFMTKRYNSWRVILLGDPLYKPFACNPQLPAPDLKDTTLAVLLIP